MVMIQVTEEKKAEMSEEGSEMMGNRRGGMGGMREPMEYGARYGNWNEEMPYDMGGMRKRYY